MTIFRFALIRGLRGRAVLIALCAIPLIMIFIHPLWTAGSSPGLFLYGMVVLYAGFLLVRSIMTDRVTGTIVRIFAAPVTPFQYLFQNLMAFWLILSVQVIFILGLGAVLYGWDSASMVKIVVCFSVFAATSVGLSLAWISLFRSREMSDGVFSVLVSVMSILGGIFVPITLLPELMRKIGMLLPVYWFSNALLTIQGTDTGYGYWVSIAILGLFTAAFLIFGSKRRLE